MCTSATPGPGLTEEQLRLATERFWRAPDAQNIDGSGLGLPIVAVLVEASGGRLDLLPAEPHGLHARLWLPAADGGPDRRAQRVRPLCSW